MTGHKFGLIGWFDFGLIKLIGLSVNLSIGDGSTDSQKKAQ